MGHSNPSASTPRPCPAAAAIVSLLRNVRYSNVAKRRQLRPGARRVYVLLSRRRRDLGRIVSNDLKTITAMSARFLRRNRSEKHHTLRRAPCDLGRVLGTLHRPRRSGMFAASYGGYVYADPSRVKAENTQPARPPPHTHTHPNWPGRRRVGPNRRIVLFFTMSRGYNRRRARHVSSVSGNGSLSVRFRRIPSSPEERQDNSYPITLYFSTDFRSRSFLYARYLHRCFETITNNNSIPTTERVEYYHRVPVLKVYQSLLGFWISSPSPARKSVPRR